MTAPAMAAVKAAVSKGVVVVRSSRVNGWIIRRNIEVNDDEIGTVASQELTPSKARVLLQLAPMPTTIAALIEAVSRERRARDRRWGKPDSRVFVYERRVGERRFGRDDAPPVDDDMIIEVTVDMSEPGPELEDITAIRELVQALRPAELAG